MPRVSPLNSQVAFGSQSSGVLFNIAGALEGFRRLAWAIRVLPGAYAHFVPAFAVFRLADPAVNGTARVIHTVLMHSSNRLPSG
jgi:hypothetical protein